MPGITLTSVGNLEILKADAKELLIIVQTLCASIENAKTIDDLRDDTDACVTVAEAHLESIVEFFDDHNLFKTDQPEDK